MTCLLRLAGGHVTTHYESFVESESHDISILLTSAFTSSSLPPDAVVLQQGLYQSAQSAKFADQLLGFHWHFVPVRPQDAGDDNVNGLQQYIIDAKRAEIA